MKNCEKGVFNRYSRQEANTFNKQRGYSNVEEKNNNQIGKQVDI